MTTNHIVTGAASGLGAAVAARLRERGDHVVTVDLRDADVEADLGTPEGRADALPAALALVDGPLAGLVPCAGLGPQVPDHALIASVNYFGAVAFLDGCADALAAGAPSAAVAISSNSTTIDPTVSADLVAAFLAGDEERARSIAADLAGNSVYASSKVAIARDVRRRVADWGARGVRDQRGRARALPVAVAPAGSRRPRRSDRSSRRSRCRPARSGPPTRSPRSIDVPPRSRGVLRARLDRLRRRRHRRAAAPRRDLTCASTAPTRRASTTSVSAISRPPPRRWCGTRSRGPGSPPGTSPTSGAVRASSPPRCSTPATRSPVSTSRPTWWSSPATTLRARPSPSGRSTMPRSRRRSR